MDSYMGFKQILWI